MDILSLRGGDPLAQLINWANGPMLPAIIRLSWASDSSSSSKICARLVLSHIRMGVVPENFTQVGRFEDFRILHGEFRGLPAAHDSIAPSKSSPTAVRRPAQADTGVGQALAREHVREAPDRSVCRDPKPDGQDREHIEERMGEASTRQHPTSHAEDRAALIAR